MFTVAELKIVTEEGAKKAINKSLTDLMVVRGQVKLDGMSRQEIDLAVHMLRQFRVMLPENPLPRPVEWREQA